MAFLGGISLGDNVEIAVCEKEDGAACVAFAEHGFEEHEE